MKSFSKKHGPSGERGWAQAFRGAAALLMAAACLPAHPEVPDAQTAASRQEQARLADTDTLLALSAEGAMLYEKDPVKLSGYQYCSQAVALAETGEFRQSIRAAGKALYLANRSGDPNLRALANRDLAIVYNYSGQYDKAVEFAREALRHEAADPKQVVGPANKVIGDVQSRRGDFAGAIASYDLALAGSSDRYAPLVRASLANALIESGDIGRAAQLLNSFGKPADAAQAAQLERSRAHLLLA